MENINNSNASQKRESFSNNLICFMFGRLTSELGSSIFKFAIGLYILDLTGSAAQFSTILALGMIPSIFVNMFAGIYIDRNNKKKIMVICELLSTATMIIFFLGFLKFSQNIIIFVLYSILLSTIQSIFSLAIYSAIPNFFEKDKVMQVNSNYQSLGAIVNILGPVLGGILYNVLGLSTLIIATGITYFVAAIVEMFLRYKPNIVKDNNNYKENFKHVFSYLKSERLIMYLLVIVLLVNFVFIPLTSIVLPFVGYKVVKFSSSQLGVIQGMWSVGVIIGALAVSIKVVQLKISNKLFRLLQIQGVFIILWTIPSWFNNMENSKISIMLIFCIALALGGALNSMINIPMLTYLQMYVPENLRGSIYGVVNTVVMIASPLGTWLYGLGVEYTSYVYPLVISSIVIIIVSTVANSSRELRTFFQKPLE